MAESKRKQSPSKPSEPPVQTYMVAPLGVRKQAENAIKSNALSEDEEFAPFYREGGIKPGVELLAPPYTPRTLAQFGQVNNALGPCVDAMETNIDGTGHTLKDREVPQDDEAAGREGEDGEVDEEKEKRRRNIEQFFDEAFPGTSFVTLRRRLRRDLELVGNAYLEFIRNLEGELIFLRHIRAKDVRLVKLDDPIVVPVTVMRGGKEITVEMHMAERRYAQRIGTKLVYFKAHGATRQLDKETGRWAKEGEVLEPNRQASEVYHFTLHPDVVTSYGVPRWIGQTPSVMGSRQAEELNLEYFASGGVPPFIITVAGGKLGDEMRATVDKMLTGMASKKQRGFVLEAIPLPAGFEKSGGTRVNMEVERFGAEQVSDSLFENYDARCEKRVRRSFRLPPLFVGQAEDFSFATAFASYTVAEAQVFKPERAEFDEFVNMVLMPELDPAGEFEFESLPIAVHDVTTKLEAIGLASEIGADDEDVLDAINDSAGLDLVMGEEDEEDEDMFGDNVVPLQPVATGGQSPQPGEPPAAGGRAPISRSVAKAQHLRRRRGKRKRRSRAKAEDLVALVESAKGLMHIKHYDEASSRSLLSVVERVRKLHPADRSAFHHMLAIAQFDDISQDPEGLAKLAGCSLEALAAGVAGATQH